MTEQVLLPTDPGWPRCLADVAPPIHRLRVRGTLPDLSHAVAVVGTRNADPEALELAEDLGGVLAAAGIPIVSGGARGIDSAAHRGALDAAGSTVAVLATGFAPPYPPRHAGLFDEIVASGALVSEVQDGTPPQPGRFLARNRLIAGLARVVLVVQAPARSGALSTARVGRALGRQVLAVPAAPWDPKGIGCVALLRGGAGICTSPQDVLSVLAFPAGESTTTRRTVPENVIDLHDLDSDGRLVFEAIGARPRHVDEVARATGLPTARVQRSLLELILSGLIDERGGGRYARAVRCGRDGA